MEVNVKEEDVIKGLKQCFDPEIPANIYDLGLVYNIEINGTEVKITMTLTSPFCPVTDYLIEDIKGKVMDFSGFMFALDNWHDNRLKEKDTRIVKFGTGSNLPSYLSLYY